jgi:Tfp pilus assembly protein PilN
MIKINLIAESKRPAAVRKAKAGPSAATDVGMYLLAAGALLGILVGLGYWWQLRQTIAEKTEEIATAEREVEALQAVIKEVEDFKAKKAKLEEKIQVINNLKTNQRGPVRVMDYVSRALPELLWLDRMKVNASNIEIEGRAFNTNAVASFIENLDDVPEFEEPVLKDTTEQPGGIYKFVINFNYSFAPPPAPATAAAPASPAAGQAPVPVAPATTSPAPAPAS